MRKRRRRTSRIETLFNAATTPVLVLGAKREIVFFNSGCERLTGWSAEDLVGRVCDYATGTESEPLESLTRALCPPPEVLSGEVASVPTYLPSRDGTSIARRLNFYPLTGGDGQVESVLGVILPLESPRASADTSPDRRLHTELMSLRKLLRRRFGVNTLVGRSRSMMRVLEQLDLARSSRSAVFFQGEAGTGKEHLARVIHGESAFHRRSFVPLDCRRLPAFQMKRTLRRLFGRGDAERAPSDAPPVSIGLHPGTLYLANVECLPRDLQQEVVAAFAEQGPAQRADLRLMASASIPLARAVDEETVREDLFYLVTPLCIEVPPLRERPDDLAPLAQFLLEQHNQGSEKQVGGFDEAVWRRFAEYNWPGNVDELSAVVGESWSACTGSRIRVEDLPFRFRTGLDAQSVGPAVDGRPVALESLLNEVETAHIQRALEQSRNNKSKAAELLGITRARLYRRMQALGIEDADEGG